MSATFTKYTNMGADAGVVAVKIGADAPILEVELNEAQELQRQALKRFIKRYVGDGIAGKGTLTYSGGNFTIANEVAYVEGDVLDIASMTVAAINGDVLYLDVYEAEATSATTLKAAGNVTGNTVTNYLIDSRVGSETSRRIVRWVTLAKATGVAGHNYLRLGTITGGVFVPSIAPTPSLLPVYSISAANTYTATLPQLTAYYKGMFFLFTATTANTGASTINLNGLGVLNIRKHVGGAVVAVEANDIPANGPVLLYYDGTQLLLLSSPSLTGANLLSKLLTVDGAGSGLDADLFDGLQSDTFCLTKKGTGAFTLGAASKLITDAFCTANSLVTVLVTGTSLGEWSVNSAAGSFTITSTLTETADVAFEYTIMKAVI